MLGSTMPYYRSDKWSCEITRKGLENQQLSGPFHLEPEFLLKILSISVYAGFYNAL